MSKANTSDGIPLAQPVPSPHEEAARLLEQAIKAGCSDPHASYLLALSYKREGKTGEARTALRKISKPDANVLLQMGLLSFREGQYAQAEQEFTLSWEMEPSSYEAAYNLLLTRLALGQQEGCTALLPKLLPLAPSTDEQRFLTLLGALMHNARPADQGTEQAANGQPQREARLDGMSQAEEQRLLQLLSSLNEFDAVYPLLRTLAAARLNSPAVQEAHLEVVLVHAKKLADRCQWTTAEQLLTPLARTINDTHAAQYVSRGTQVAFLNLLGCCACMTQDFDRGVRLFNAALKLAGNDVWLHQNLALACEWQERLEQADVHWNRYFDILMDNRVPTPDLPNYLESLAYEGLTRLAETYSRKEKWTSALSYVQRAHRLRPGDADTLERLFHLYTQLKRPEDARRTLRKLRDLRPDDPQFDLYELDVREVRSLEDIEKMLSEIRRILNEHPNDMRVEERAVGMVGNVIPHIGRLCEQYSERLGRVVEQVRRLPRYQINWPVVHDEMHKFIKEFQKLRRITQKCSSLVTNEEHRRVVREQLALMDSKIELCQSLGG